MITSEQQPPNLNPAPVVDVVGQIRALARNYRTLELERARIEEHQAAIRQRVRALLDVGDAVDVDGKIVRVSVNRRFDPELAQTLLPPDLLAMCRVVKIDPAAARKVLAPALYDACMTEVGEPRVVLS